MIKPRLPSVQKYVEDCLILLKSQNLKSTLAEKLQIQLLIYPPDQRKRDIDNVCKVVLDTLQRAGIYENDFKVWKLTLERKEVRQYGEVEFTITSLGV
jgi:crossover junction endodeoxyribonuclease RusA